MVPAPGKRRAEAAPEETLCPAPAVLCAGELYGRGSEARPPWSQPAHRQRPRRVHGAGGAASLRRGRARRRLRFLLSRRAATGEARRGSELIMEEVHKSSSNSSVSPSQPSAVQGTTLQAAQLSHIAQQMSLRGPAPLTVVQLPGEQVQVQGVIQTAQSSSVIHSPQVQTVQVSSLSESEDSQDSSDSIGSSQKARGILARRPSYRELYELTPAVSCTAQNLLSTTKPLGTFLFLASPAGDGAVGPVVALWVQVCGREADGLNGAAVAQRGAELHQGEVVLEGVPLEFRVHNDASDVSPGCVSAVPPQVVHAQNSPPGIGPESFTPGVCSSTSQRISPDVKRGLNLRRAKRRLQNSH
uniref:KID domain-containing protein n=1 Tax=Amazona collaria TaxID=241587 RepID=A0A8B9GDK9_9PSIT